jgi:hypothetical protein
MRIRSILNLSASMLLAACAHPAPSGAPGMAWSASRTDSEGAKLAFGQPQSDIVLLMLTCQPRSGLVRLSATAPVGATGALQVVSNGERQRLDGEVVPGMTTDGVLVQATASARSPALARFASTGDLMVVEGRRRTALPARGHERAAIQQFFAACGT